MRRDIENRRERWTERLGEAWHGSCLLLTHEVTMLEAALPAAPVYVPGRSAEEVAATFGLSCVVKLSSNACPLGPSPRAMAAARGALEGMNRYPQDGAPALKAALAARHGLSASQLLITQGSTEAIHLLVAALARPGEAILIPAHTFIAYERAAALCGVAVHKVSHAGFATDLDALTSAVTPDTRLVFLANPNNPTGTCHGQTALAAWLRRLPTDVVVVIDEA